MGDGWGTGGKDDGWESAGDGWLAGCVYRCEFVRAKVGVRMCVCAYICISVCMCLGACIHSSAVNPCMCVHCLPVCRFVCVCVCSFVLLWVAG